MWNRIEIRPRRGLFLMNNGLYIYPDKNINEEDRDKIIGYCLDDSRIISINSSENPILWSLRNGKIPGLTCYEYPDGSIEPYNDLDGEYNTRCIIEFCKKNNVNLQNIYPSIYYCKSFNPGYKDGEWYLPSMGELKLFYDERNEFRKSCKLIELETNMNSDSSGAYNFWTSTEFSDALAWSLYFGYSNSSVWNSKYSRYYIVPFLNLNPLKP